MTLQDAQMYIDSFSRPDGLNTHSWRVIKKIAFLAWESYLTNQKFSRSINFMCKEFYQMIKTPEGEYIVPKNTFYHDHDF